MKRWVWWVGTSAIIAAAAAVPLILQKEIPLVISEGARNDSGIQIEVLNGCGIDGLARKAAEFLRDGGFDVLTVSNAGSYDYAETLVIDRVGKLNNARKVADELGVATCIQQIVPDPFRIEEVTVIIGKDYPRLEPFSTP